MQEICIKITDVFSPELREKLEQLCTDKKMEVAFKYVSDFRSTGLLRNYISELCSMCNLDKTWISRITLLTDELNNNAIEYWSKSWEYNKMIFKLNDLWNEIELIISVEDTWNWKKSKTAKEMLELKNKKKEAWFNGYMWIRGRWLFLIIDKMVDELGFEDTKQGWLRVTIKKRIKK